jgi:cytochrome c oxidase subunit 3
MARLTPISHRPSTGHNGGALPPHTGGGGDRDGRGSGDSMPNYGARLRRARMGLAVAIVPILMLFISFTVAYIAWRWFSTSDITNVRASRPIQLRWALLLANTAVLVVSSVTMELSRRAITRQSALAPVMSIPGISLGNERHFPWLGLTTILGLLFLAGQVFLWNGLLARGFHMNSGPASSFVYFVTAMHALHLAGGILVLLTANVMAGLRRPIETRRIVVDVTTWYWHVMTGLWIYILILFSIAT